MFNKKDSVKLELNYRGFERIEGSDFLVAPLSSPQKVVKGVQYVAHNYLFLNVRDFSTHWLFATNNQVVSLFYQIPLENSRVIRKNLYHEKYSPFYDGNHFSETISQTGWLLFLFADVKMNSDKKIIALSDVSGRDFIELINDVDFIYDKVRLDKDRLILMYRSNDEVLVSEIQLSGSKLIKSKELPKV